MAEYLIRWKIDIDATNPVEAAKKARKIQLDTKSIATVFEVTDKSANKTSEVDLSKGMHERTSDGIDLKEAQSIAEEILRVIAENQDSHMVQHFMEFIGAELDLTDEAILEAWETIEQERIKDAQEGGER